jgi:hypothetical protein
MLRACYILATFLILLLILIRAFRHFDRLVQIEYQKYRHLWIKDGEPSGFFWKPPESSHLGNTLAMQRLSLAWVFKAPAWIHNDSEAVINLKKLRFYFMAWNLGLIVWYLTIVSLS